MSRENRRHPRVPLSFLVQYRSDSFEDFLAEYAMNLSTGGMFVRTTEPREPGTLVYFQFLLKDGSRLIEGLGKVVWARAEGGGGGPGPGMGVEFVSLDAASVALIDELVRAGCGTHVESDVPAPVPAAARASVSAPR